MGGQDTELSGRPWTKACQPRSTSGTRPQLIGDARYGYWQYVVARKPEDCSSGLAMLHYEMWRERSPDHLGHLHSVGHAEPD